MDIITGVLTETWRLLVEMAPFLVFGFLVAGILHVLIPGKTIGRHCAGTSFRAVVTTALIGVPLPLCSCGVIPVAAHLRKQGAGKGPTLSFLISTPTTGIDSILATYGLLGWLFAVVRPVSAFIAGIIGGAVTNLAEREHGASEPPVETRTCELCGEEEKRVHEWIERLTGMFRYAFGDLIDDSGGWLIVGILAGGIISFFVPEEVVGRYLGNPLLAYPLMMLIGIPLYVCASASIPIAASLIMKGMAPGAAFVFLFTGPATNTATISFVGGTLGRRALSIYLLTIACSAIIFGMVIDALWPVAGTDVTALHAHGGMLPAWLNTGAAFFLVAAVTASFVMRLLDRFSREEQPCPHCIAGKLENHKHG